MDKSVQNSAEIVIVLFSLKDSAYIIWTGDLVPHNVWSTSKEDNIYIMERLMNLIQRYFPSTPLYATLGNHESHPTDT